MIKTFSVIILCVGITSGVAVADVWVNAAGHAIDAELIECRNGIVEFKTSKGKKISMPLRGLSKESQKAVLKVFPPPVKSTPKDKARGRIRKRRDVFNRRSEKKATAEK